MVTSVEPCQEDELHTAARAGLGGVGLFNGRQWTQKVPLFSVRILVYLELPSMISLAEPEYRNSKKGFICHNTKKTPTPGVKSKDHDTTPRKNKVYLHITKIPKTKQNKIKTKNEKRPNT